jgi:hypothetical protein
MFRRGIRPQNILTVARRVDPKIDRPAVDRIVGDIVLPTPAVLAAICDTLHCTPADLYEIEEITLDKRLLSAETSLIENGSSARCSSARAHHHPKNIYNLTVEIPRDIAERVFSKDALSKLGYASKTDFVRQAVCDLDAKIKELGGGNADE